MELFGVILFGFFSFVLASSKLSSAFDTEMPVATAVNSVLPKFPSKVVFTGLDYWDSVADLVVDPYIFVSDFELNFDFKTKFDHRINFGLKLTKEEVQILNVLKPALVSKAILKYKANFFQVTGTHIQFCMSDQMAILDPSTLLIFRDHGIIYFPAYNLAINPFNENNYHFLKASTEDLQKFAKFINLRPLRTIAIAPVALAEPSTNNGNTSVRSGCHQSCTLC